MGNRDYGNTHILYPSRVQGHGRLCYTCSAIFAAPQVPLQNGHGADVSYDDWILYTHQHHEDFASFTHAVDSGCYICSEIRSRIEAKSGENCALLLTLPRYHVTPYHEGQHRYDACFWINFSVHTGSNSPYGDSDSIRIVAFHALPQAEASEFSLQTNLAASTGSAQSLRQARAWIKHCNYNHRECRQLSRRPRLPTRLISVDPNRSTHARLCTGVSLPAGTPYLTLSHCWGSTSFLTLTKESVDNWYQQIPVDELSRTFQDAFTALAALGFHYIWIDSLCIIQDDELDWQKQSKSMGDIYKNAACNLAASAFATGGSGLFTQRQLSKVCCPMVKVRWEDEPGSMTWPVKAYNQLYFITSNDPWSALFEARLYTRAWVLQEQLLAPRTVHFGPDQLFWECNNRLASETWPDERAHRRLDYDCRFTEENAQKPEPLFSITAKKRWSREAKFFIAHPSEFSDLEAGDIYGPWTNIVDNYTSRFMSYRSDRLPALAGIASEFAKLLNDEYMYGLWSKDLHHGLLWRHKRDDAPEIHAPPNLSLAPSWSWASLDGPVEWYGDGQPIYRPIDDGELLCKIVSSPGSPQLQITGHLFSLTTLKFRTATSVWAKTKRDFDIYSQAPQSSLYVELAQWYFDLFSNDPGIPEENEQTMSQGMEAEMVFLQRQAALKNAYILPVILAQRDCIPVVCGLVLVLRPEAGDGVHIRAGTFQTTLPDVVDDFDSDFLGTSELLAYLRKEQMNVDERSNRHQDHKGRVSITLV
ncbi:heterokaryon incompatibility protein-domain-containing protein [Clohesyomyces aquaticus]|uniref:Heterokaryon incompatibility protein-domain-containing protein n=1 Tax=Clohesyomyces aquaticus TaxID=1231657 RepID=A0A1Y1ZFQ8_9PLEO|nr:heterokaryon incompatibility protein-domain-containing protein [Clohesyomyces aquaticus]